MGAQLLSLKQQQHLLAQPLEQHVVPHLSPDSQEGALQQGKKPQHAQQQPMLQQQCQIKRVITSKHAFDLLGEVVYVLSNKLVLNNAHLPLLQRTQRVQSTLTGYLKQQKQRRKTRATLLQGFP
jgi:hypothetical protein